VIAEARRALALAVICQIMLISGFKCEAAARRFESIFYMIPFSILGEWDHFVGPGEVETECCPVLSFECIYVVDASEDIEPFPPGNRSLQCFYQLGLSELVLRNNGSLKRDIWMNSRYAFCASRIGNVKLFGRGCSARRICPV
jgi:hypothetical protein